MSVHVPSDDCLAGERWGEVESELDEATLVSQLFESAR